MKRVLASILMTVVLLLSLSVPAGADHAVPFPTKVIPLWNADENWDTPSGFVVDRENQVEGEGCVSIELSKNATFISQAKLPEVDATGMRYLEFDVYVSDLAILEAWLDTEGGFDWNILKRSAGSRGKAHPFIKDCDAVVCRWVSSHWLESHSDTAGSNE